MMATKKRKGRAALNGKVRNVRMRFASDGDYMLVMHTLSPELRGEILAERARQVQGAAFERIVKAVGRVK